MLLRRQPPRSRKRFGEKLSFDTYAFDFFDGVNLPAEPESVPARAWLAGKIEEESEFFEQSLSLGSYGVVLSLLWICDDQDYVPTI